jgi:hypothetical protein
MFCARSEPNTVAGEPAGLPGPTSASPATATGAGSQPGLSQAFTSPGQDFWVFLVKYPSDHVSKDEGGLTFLTGF